MSRDATKPVFEGLRTTQAQTTLGIAQSDQRLCYSLIGKFHIKTCYKQISIISLVSVAEETGLSLSSSETPKTGFITSRPTYEHQHFDFSED